MNRRFFIITFLCFCFAAAFAQQSEWRDLIDKKQFGQVLSQAAYLSPADSVDLSKMYFTYLYVSEVLKRLNKPEQLKQYLHLRSTLKKFEEEMFFRGVDHLPMLSPDNKKNTLSKEKLKELIEKLPEKTY
ncbi:MAG: hypothetical protein LBG28_15620 [Tannerella sp.]|jgi:glutaredoxin-related protein|nr:hypothetical protein [Tannerella sp.]